MKISSNGLAFIAAHEGVVTRAYLDPVGIVTIGIGFTMRSTVFAAYWRRKHGRSLRLGDTMTTAECYEILLLLVDSEYGAAVARKFRTSLPQHRFDAVCSVVFNCGATTLSDRWATALAKGEVAEAARLLRVTRVTGDGKRLQGLVNRRAEEARLLEFGNYGAGTKTRSSRYDLIVEGQKLLVALGFDPGPADGIEGDRTKGASLAYQLLKPDLVDDGVIGPATIASLRRDVSAHKAPLPPDDYLETADEALRHPDDVPPAPSVADPTPSKPDDTPDVPPPEPPLTAWQRFWRWLSNL